MNRSDSSARRRSQGDEGEIPVATTVNTETEASYTNLEDDGEEPVGDGI